MQEKKSLKLGLVITDGVGYRNFVLSDFLMKAGAHFQKVIIYSGLPKDQYHFEPSEKVKIIELPVFVEPFSSWFWRKFKELAHLQLHKDHFGIKVNLENNNSRGKSNRAKAGRLLYKITSSFHSEGLIQKLEKFQQRSLRRNAVTKACYPILKETVPDLLFFTHQRPPYVMPLYIAAGKLGIKTCSFIFSWDNLSSKGRMAANFDSYLVWSELMKDELLYFYPSTAKEKVKVAGTPQFEPYVLDHYQTEKQSFYRRFDLDPQLKTICYSCGDVSTSPNDGIYIEAIANSIKEKKISLPVNLVVRTSPAEDPDRFFHLKEKFPFIIWNFPDWPVSRKNHPEPWSQRVPSKKDISDLRALLEFSDLSINMCSTMSLDFMIFDKPVINPVFGNMENELFDDQKFLKFGHYEKVVKSGAVKIVKDVDSLVNAINFYLVHPESNRKERQKLIAMQIGKPLPGTSERIARLLKETSEV